MVLTVTFVYKVVVLATPLVLQWFCTRCLAVFSMLGLSAFLGWWEILLFLVNMTAFLGLAYQCFY